MKKHVVVFLALAWFLAAGLMAQVPAKIYVVHGIPGIDVMSPDPALPVDISVDGLCPLVNFKFGEVAGPLELTAGTYAVAVRPHNPVTPCGSAPIIGPVDLTFEAGISYTIIAHLTADCQPTASLFTNNLGPTGPGKARVILHHTACAPPVDVRVSRNPANMNAPKIFVGDFANGDQVAAEIQPGMWQVTLAPAGTGTVVVGPVPLLLKPFTAYLIYAVGSLTNNTFTFIVEPVEKLKAKGKKN